MKVVNSTPSEFRNRIHGKRVICFGGGDYFGLFAFDFGEGVDVVGVIDNDPHKHGRTLSAGGLAVPVISPTQAVRMQQATGAVLVITASDCHSILQQLWEIPEFENVDCFLYASIKYRALKPIDHILPFQSKVEIPPVIHYCWFGGKPLPELQRRCIDSWRAHCPGYEIVEWNEGNYDYTKSVWTRTAFEQKKWAFLTDYARFDILLEHGGIYFDTDVELLRSPDPLRYNQGFAATEAHGGVNSGSGIGAMKGLPVFRELLAGFQDEYRAGVTFCKNVKRETELFWRHGYRLNGEFQMIEHVAVLPFNILTPIVNDTGENFITDATVGVHHFMGGWRKL